MAQVAIGLAVSAAVSFASAALTPQPKPSPSDLYITSSSYGDPIPVAYGDTRVACHLIWSDGVKHVVKGKGGKGGSAPKIHANLAFSICEGPVDNIITIWANGKIIYDSTGKAKDANNKSLVGTGRYTFRFYKGTETQYPDPLIKSYVEKVNGLHSTPAYRGLAYMVIDDMDLTEFGGMIPTMHAEVVHASTSSITHTDLATVSAPLFTSGYTWMTVDKVLRRMYVFHNEGISVYDLTSDKEVAQVSWATVGINTALCAIPTVWGVVPGKFLVGVSADLSGAHPFAAQRMVTLDLNSLRYLKTGAPFSYPIDGYSDGNVTSITGFTLNLRNGSVSSYAITSDLRGKFYLLAVQVFSATSFGTILAEETLAYAFPWGSIDPGDYFGLLNGPKVVIMPQVGLHVVAYATPSSVAGTSMGIYYFDVTDGYGNSGGLSALIDLSVYGLAGPFQVGDVTLDTTDSSLIINLIGTGLSGHAGGSMQQAMFKWLPGTGVTWCRTDTSTPANVGYNEYSFAQNVVTNGRYVSFNNARSLVVDTGSGTTLYDQNLTSSAGVGTSPAFQSWQQVAADPISQSIIVVNAIGSTPVFHRVFFNQVSGTGTTLATIMSNLCYRAGLKDADFDVSLLSTSLPGYVIGRRTDLKSVIDQLQTLFFFDVVETNSLIKFVPKGLPTIVVIPQSDLGETKNSKGGSTGDGNFWKLTQIQEPDLPAEVHVKYFDVNRNYQYGDQSFRRIYLPVTTMHAKNIKTYEVPIVLTANTAANMAQSLVFLEWVERDRYETTLGPKYTWLDPSDVVTIALDNGYSYNVKTSKIVQGGDLSHVANFIAQDAAVFTGTAVGASGDNLIAPGFAATVVSTTMILIDVPLLADTDALGTTTSPLFIGCVSYSAAVWSGAEISKSIDGAVYQKVTSITKMLFSGSLSVALPPTGSPFMLDNTTTIQVHAYAGVSATLSSTSLTALNAGSNWAVVGGEIIAFLNATLNADGSFTLSGLYRGLRGTDYLCNYHSIGESLILLDGSVLIEDTYSSSSVGQSWEYRAASFGAFVDHAATQGVLLTGAALKPYPVADITRTVSGSDLALSWTRRTRLGGGMVDLIGTVPLSETTEAYEAYILAAPYNPSTFDPTNSATYLHAYTGLTSPTCTYTAAQMSADSFAMSTATLHIVVYQLSSVVGRGFPSPADLVAF